MHYLFLCSLSFSFDFRCLTISFDFCCDRKFAFRLSLLCNFHRASFIPGQYPFLISNPPDSHWGFIQFPLLTQLKNKDKKMKWGIFQTLKSNTVVSNHFHSIKILLFSSARSRDFDGTPGTELPVSMYTTKTPNPYVPF